jgi:hypothetical protein
MPRTQMVIEVKLLVSESEVHPDDQGEEGGDAVSGLYLVPSVGDTDDEQIESALDYFHDHIGIKVLDHYDIHARQPTDEDFNNDLLIDI